MQHSSERKGYIFIIKKKKKYLRYWSIENHRPYNFGKHLHIH